MDGTEWDTIAGPYSRTSPVWSPAYVDLSAYADSTVRIAFHFISDWVYEDNGWYIDDISVVKGPLAFNNPEDFENGAGDWGADNGLWEVGIPIVGPANTPSGQNCAGTVLKGDYPSYGNTRLISPEITLTPAQGYKNELYFWHWFRLYNSAQGPDEGRVQISVNGGDWQTIAGPYTGISPVWSQVYVDLSAYADSTVRFAFYFTSDWVYEDDGWYIDDLRIEEVTSTQLQSFLATCSESGIRLDWRLAEAGTDMEFFILRVEAPGADFRELEDPEITGDGLSFSFVDKSVKPGLTYSYRVHVSDEDGRRILFETAPISTTPLFLTLNQNAPNPFNPGTTISFTLPGTMKANLAIFDVEGKLIRTLLDETLSGGLNEAFWDGTDDRGSRVSSGIYFYRLKAGKRVLTRKLALLR